jgi:hypothetical protein
MTKREIVIASGSTTAQSKKFPVKTVPVQSTSYLFRHCEPAYGAAIQKNE